jgi:hypothetical protein
LWRNRRMTKTLASTKVITNGHQSDVSKTKFKAELL